MNLWHIKEETCAACGSRVTSEEQKNQHTSGEWNESRRFECGREIRYSPNFRRVEVTWPCPKSAEEVMKKNKRVEAKAALIEFIDGLDVDETFKGHLKNSLQ